MSAQIKIIGDQKLINTLSLAGALNGELGAALFQVANEIIKDSKDNYVPVGDTGALHQSATVLSPEFNTKGEVSVTFGYDTQYAEIVHDRPPTIGQGKVKYLEIPFVAAMQKAQALIQQHTLKAINTIKKTKRPTPENEWRKYQSTEASGKRNRTTHGDT